MSGCWGVYSELVELPKHTHFLFYSFFLGSNWSKWFFTKHFFIFFLMKKKSWNKLKHGKSRIPLHYFAVIPFYWIVFFQSKKKYFLFTKFSYLLTPLRFSSFFFQLQFVFLLIVISQMWIDIIYENLLKIWA